MKNNNNLLILWVSCIIIITFIVIYIIYNQYSNDKNITDNTINITSTNSQVIDQVSIEQKEVKELTQEEILKSQFLWKCQILWESTNLLETFKNEFQEEFTWDGKTQWEIKLYNTIISYLEKWESYIEFENKLFDILWEADWDDLEIFKLNINIFYAFFYSQNYEEEFDCKNILDNHSKQ